jgi:hypothetical protein
MLITCTVTAVLLLLLLLAATTAVTAADHQQSPTEITWPLLAVSGSTISTAAVTVRNSYFYGSYCCLPGAAVITVTPVPGASLDVSIMSPDMNRSTGVSSLSFKSIGAWYISRLVSWLFVKQ